MKSKLIIRNKEIILVLCDNSNFCISLKELSKISNYDKEYIKDLSLQFINSFENKELDNKNYYLSVDINDNPNYYRNKDMISPLLISNDIKTDDETEYFLLFKETKKNILCLKSEI